MSRYAIIIAVFTLMNVSIVPAQIFTPQRQPTNRLACADFHRNSDGSWSPIHPVVICPGVQTRAGVMFEKGVIFCGVNVVATLNQQCTR
jgi:hypothetical protein